MSLQRFAGSAARGAAKGILTGLIVINLGAAALVYPLASKGADRTLIEDTLRTYSHDTFGPAGGEIFHVTTSPGRYLAYIISGK
ncbi:MAG: hypothetical protein HYW26_01325 [Candidatus Aenigmarchaeota archaeon]|nr:hypothetical protein [Candidatus Aenigmarchaeota archaeon]